MALRAHAACIGQTQGHRTARAYTNESVPHSSDVYCRANCQRRTALPESLGVFQCSLLGEE